MEQIYCAPRSLPADLWVAAARTAVECNPANCPARRGLAALGVSEPQHVALLTSKYWGQGGVRLGVTFMDTQDAQLKARILAHMSAWSQYANVQFMESARGEVRITRTPRQGYYSYLGTDILHIPANQNTMNLDSFSMQTPESEYRRVVRHETGHTLGFPHEHMRREIVARIDPRRAIAYFLQMDGWDAQTTQRQVLTPINEADLTPGPVDRTSIMCYQLPGSIMTDGAPVPGGSDIDAQDGAFAGRMYPSVVAPPPPPPPAGGAPAELWAVDAGDTVIRKYKPA